MRKPLAIIPPVAPPKTVKTAPKAVPKTQPKPVVTATLQPPAAPAKRVPKAAQPPAQPALFQVAAAPRGKAGKTVPPAPSQLTPKAAKAKPVKTAKAAPIRAAKTLTVKAAATRPTPVRVVAETPATYFAGAGGHAWRLSSRYAIAYVRDAALAGEMLATEPRYLAKVAMAVYYDRKGKPFAWQFRFETARWAEVVGRLG